MDLDEALRMMFRVVLAIMLRESRTRYGDSRFGYLWALIDPVIVMSLMVLLFGIIGRTSPVAASLPVFILTGYMPFFLMRNVITRGASAAAANRGLLQYPQVAVADIVLARIVLEVSTATVVYVVLIVALFYGIGEPLSSWFDDPAGIIGAALGIFYFCLGSAFFSSGLARIWPMWPNIWSYISRPLFLLSGVFFTLENLPTSGRAVMQYNPLAHVLEWFRSVSLPGFESNSYSIVMVLATGTITGTIGLLIDRYLVLTGDEEIVG
ncbi:MAG: ABC transporter permease [Sphingomonadaceae bacterium]|nr:ABC transporter permease [Sphingomonadaceae bacterium]